MDDRFSYEKLSIRDSARSSKKYGSTSSRNYTINESYIKHAVSKTDTLQGLALRYGVTMEQIRRANRLFTSDSLFLREFLLIPSPDGQPMSPTSESSRSSMETTPSCSQVTSPTYDEENAAQFLIKIDASIASTKEGVQKIHKSSEFAGLEFGSERRKPMSRMKQMVNNNGVNDILKTPQAVVTTQGNKIKTSMRRYQQQQDELFEL